LHPDETREVGLWQGVFDRKVRFHDAFTLSAVFC